MGTSRAMLSCSSTLIPGGAVDRKAITAEREMTADHRPHVRLWVQALPLQVLTIDAVQRPPGGRFGGLRLQAVDFFRTEAQEQNEDEGDQKAGQQQGGHHDHLLLVHTDLCKAHTVAVPPVCLVTTDTPD